MVSITLGGNDMDAEKLSRDFERTRYELSVEYKREPRVTEVLDRLETLGLIEPINQGVAV